MSVDNFIRSTCARHDHHFPELAEFCNMVLASQREVQKAAADHREAVSRFCDASIKLGRSLAGMDPDHAP